MPKNSFAASLPLFDRLALPAHAATRPHVADTFLKQSILHELQRLLSSRSRLPFDVFVSEAADLLDYGIPDSSAMTMASIHDRAMLAKAIRHAISVFEPRLHDVTVEITPTPERGADARVRIEGMLWGQRAQQRTTFAMSTSGHIAPEAGTGPDNAASRANANSPPRPDAAMQPDTQALPTDSRDA
ncbi:type VI secretion system baseplate subunit TssE [Robbsia andropogonis]|uniref:type VI secretion system baseplate subunit TssE n=1 Tax=Robbsia andropogonis TaxID=28092 RepID=UPI00046694E3|nr:type VI secretion system baseplate subunit TssE [Robbsia andropogonis]MCP1118043.1 type VI secretion system baseplate subunit TssE [Robbsia andropogonis]MCP1127676.1 type VI secretion system baseplate subunit TssE [Robbsia andropogonis]